VLTNLYAARRMAYLTDFSSAGWLERVASERVTSAMLVPTMLARIVDELDGAVAEVPSLRAIAYGGARLPVRSLRRRSLRSQRPVHQRLRPDRDKLDDRRARPEDHRVAAAADDPAVGSDSARRVGLSPNRGADSRPQRGTARTWPRRRAVGPRSTGVR